MEDMTMRNFDFSPLMRSTIGFDRIGQMFEDLERTQAADKYPPYNIVKRDADNYRISMAIAGFSEDDIDITVTENTLKITGEINGKPEDNEYLYQGLAARAFTRQFELADTIKVVGADMQNGLLHIDLVREIPEALKPRHVEIGKSKLLSDKAA
jgi:molecular chaperone IbpA